jgi:hypothetical protein
MVSNARHSDCCLCGMATLLIFWVLISFTLCLALFGIAARPAPRKDERIAFGTVATSQREPGVVLEGARLLP